MNTQVNRIPPTAPAWLYLQRAREAVSRAATELPRTQFDPQARRQYALELAELMGQGRVAAEHAAASGQRRPLRALSRNRLASGTATQITEIRRQSLTLMAAILSASEPCYEKVTPP
jgi:hypothetical protein